ncbi:protein-lysine N-methyltransferase EEF2KMT isoform X2 [Hoplias malabaricus]|uniref:protein-lysine N-methyltransferase EEF2KMT isoform X2 n=1 Tax=Hoplias malabaricus TaxID=27720 RepID=UPI003462FF77
MNNSSFKELSLSFQRNFFAMRRLNAFQWESLEAELKSSESPSEVILDVLRKHERTAVEPLDELYDALAEVIGAEEEPVCFKTYLLPSGESVSLEENVAVISEGTTGLVTWEAALYLSEWALERPHVFTDRAVLELGSGAGLTGVVVCQVCKPRRYIFSDCHQTVLQRLRNNIQHNGLFEHSPHTTVCVEELDWDNVDEEELQRIGADTVIAADVVYDPEMLGALVRLLAKLLAFKTEERPPEVYVASTVRNPDTYDCFRNELEKAGLKHHVVSCPVPHVLPYTRVSTVEIIKIHR